MPANNKYLTQNKWQRFAKITAGFLGGYLVAITFHLALATWLHKPSVIITATFSAFIIWAVLMVLAFLAHNGWKVWALYLSISLFFLIIFYFGNN
ncbi:hypothetical protein SAMN05216480_11139 [Pustulibacterium marinum]|uniref:DUF3649 domain-containing protein n=1 Tax=Pustulibacterium marinum TaxID=1224947 RepID=A0A1I7HUX4_9FLAO|nr:hypothetical protein [Pustulibacterium marinum]SFU64441.1 hypothetical protein SAMN05216480_11139 [Pustulibacterium marinum]